MKTEKINDYKLKYDNSKAAKDRVFNIMLAHFKKLEHYTGDSLAQSDDTYINCVEILADVAEMGFKFEQEYDD